MKHRIGRRTYALILTLAVLPAASPALGTDLDLFRNKIGRFANESAFAPNAKRYCVCLEDDNPENVGKGGVIAEQVAVGGDGFRRVQVRCFVRKFNPDGGNTLIAEGCSPAWVLLR